MPNRNKKRTNLRGAKRKPDVYCPKQQLTINLYQDISDHASELLWGQGFIAKYDKSERADRRMKELLDYNRVNELFPYLEKLLSLKGNVYTTIDLVDGKPTLTIADPQLNSQAIAQIPSTDGTIYGMGRAFVTDVVAVIWKRITYGTVSFPIKEIWDKDKVVRHFFGENNKIVKVAEVNKVLPPELQVTELWEHNMGFIPVMWHKNVPTFGAASYPDGYKGAAAQAIVDKTLSELWHETETNRTKIIGSMDESSYNQISKDGLLEEINKNDYLINIHFKNSAGAADNQIIPVMGDPKFDMYWLSIDNAKDEFYKLAGYSPLGDGNTEKTATENLLMKTGDYQTTKKKRELRMRELIALISYMLKIDAKWGFGDIYGDVDSNFTFQIMENKVMDSLQEITNVVTMVEHDFMSKVEAIAQFRGVTIDEARELYTEILNTKKFEADLLESLGLNDEDDSKEDEDKDKDKDKE